MTTGLTFDQAAERASCQVRYARSPVPRRFGDFGLSGSGPLDSAVNEGELCLLGSEWGVDFCDEAGVTDPDDRTVDWHSLMFGAAVQEAVHEACEWFQVDGERYLDPHDPEVQTKITNATRAFALLLVEIREGRQ